MFTGIIKELARVKRINSFDYVSRLVLDAPKVSEAAELGDSIAVNGVCLSVTKKEGSLLFFDIVPTTFSKTTLSSLRDGDIAHIEPALRFGDTVDGHLVSGHVDGIGVVVSLESVGDSKKLAISFSQNLAPYIALKGSIAVDGVSLTVASLTKEVCTLALIPLTLKETHLGDLSPGDLVNIEVDMFARYAERKKNFSDFYNSLSPSHEA